MPPETFRERFQRLVEPLSDTELALALGVSADAARKMRRGDIKSLKFESGLRLCERLGVDPYYLQFGRKPGAQISALRAPEPALYARTEETVDVVPAELTLRLFDATFRALQAIAKKQDLQLDLPSLDEVRPRPAQGGDQK